eukprot:scaffold24286_cov111-Isochrysis_galbana.AAC.4
MLRGLLERAKLLFAIVDLTSVNGTAFRQVCVACETHTGVAPSSLKLISLIASSSAPPTAATRLLPQLASCSHGTLRARGVRVWRIAIS